MKAKTYVVPRGRPFQKSFILSKFGSNIVSVHYQNSKNLFFEKPKRRNICALLSQITTYSHFLSKNHNIYIPFCCENHNIPRLYKPKMRGEGHRFMNFSQIFASLMMREWTLLKVIKHFCQVLQVFWIIQPIKAFDPNVFHSLTTQCFYENCWNFFI